MINPKASGSAINGDVTFNPLKAGPCTQFSDLEYFLQDDSLFCQSWNLEFEGDRHCSVDARTVSISYTAEAKGNQEELSMSWDLDLGSSSAFECAVDLGTFEIALQIEGSSGDKDNFDNPTVAYLDDSYYFRIAASSGSPVTAVSVDTVEIQSATGDYLCTDCQDMADLGLIVTDWNPDNFILQMILASSLFQGHLTATFTFTFDIEMSASTDPTRRRLQDAGQQVQQRVMLRLKPGTRQKLPEKRPPTQADYYATSEPTTMPTVGDYVMPEDSESLTPVATESTQKLGHLHYIIGAFILVFLTALYCYLRKCVPSNSREHKLPTNSSSKINGDEEFSTVKLHR